MVFSVQYQQQHLCREGRCCDFSTTWWSFGLTACLVFGSEEIAIDFHRHLQLKCLTGPQPSCQVHSLNHIWNLDFRLQVEREDTQQSALFKPHIK